MEWYKIKNKTEKAEIWIYEMIGKDFWSADGLTAKNFQKDLAEIKSKQIDLHINSPGGDVFDGNAIYNLLKQHPANITTYIDGIAASIASVIALAGDKIYMAENALFMLHQPYAFTMGNEDDHEKTLEILRQVGGSIARTYIAKTGKDEDEIKNMMKVETWLNSDEALEAGFVDEITDKMDMAACAKFVPVMSKLGFKKIPDVIDSKETTLSAKSLERALRDAGCSIKQAKVILAEGFSDDLRDVDQVETVPAPVVEEPRDVVPADAPRDVVQPVQNKKDRTKELIRRAELTLPKRRP